MLTRIEEILFASMIFFLMVAMGTTLTLENFKKAVHSKKPLLIGMLSQFGFMPLIAFGLAKGFGLSPSFAIGLILVGCTPGGTTSNLLTYYAKGDVALSISMTIASTILAIVMMPFLFWLYCSGFNVDQIQIPYKSIIGSIVVLIFPVLIGIKIRSANIRLALKIEKIGSVLGILMILFLLIVMVPKNIEILKETTIAMYVSAILITVLGYVFGYTLSKLFNLTIKQSTTVSLETGIQNGPLTIAVILLSFPPVLVNEILWMPLLYALFVPVTSSIATLFFYLKSKKNQKEQVK
ncbi:bile acid:sodium symporter [Leptospira sp. 2 VSF19]|uniref:Bile acid:sodium symporter n=1 Tax=Leptospira soteropolitanensis TaxID=2950025 RepID=A0AAW5V8T7_9LEPT|nr:bile acid:sodium symporter [Leptospira soteropolitanensis]MCW7491648.1 bile acid:sodium symporter [Leptospira soteropolitanensis]MCW7499232.1 bile acid:sodium symporter [Leptospira soteropolitanensis]MCW7521176.1 bile acid:sodium symporter [Leptospira soteropolitanensis]MCW7525336.1 bile acid:sodium symporter [Leptospira soteropolitanensis]MCW7529203.1 bile acid:sodium symporter [Leptospira soteropolitanensis]